MQSDSKADVDGVVSVQQNDGKEKTPADDVDFVIVTDNDADEAIELPLEPDRTLLLSTLTSQFPGASGLKYKNLSTGCFRGLKLSADGLKIFPPTDGWAKLIFTVVFPKEQNTKRKIESENDVEDSGSKQKRVDVKKKCSDLIVLGLPYATNEEQLREYFEQFGEVVVSQVKRDLRTGKSKGFGFVRYADYDSQMKVLSQRHQIEGRACDVKIPHSREDENSPLSKRVFVGRVPESLTADDLREYFSKYGEITDVFMPKPYRAFAFVTFSDAEVAQTLCGEDHVIKGASVHVSNAVAKQTDNDQQGHHGGGRGDRGSDYDSHNASGNRHRRSPDWGTGGGSSNAKAARSSPWLQGDASGSSPAWLSGRNQSMNSGAGTLGSTTPSAPANGSSLAAGTSQATLGMGQLNLGNLGVNPALLATAQAALLSALTQAQHQQPNMQPDINALLSQYSSQLTAGQQPSVGSYGSNMGTPSGYWNPQRTDSPSVDHVMGSGQSHSMSHHPYQRHAKKPREYYGN